MRRMRTVKIEHDRVLLGFPCHNLLRDMASLKESRDAGREESDASHAKENLETRKKFDEEMDRPLSGGSNLIRKLRDWSQR